jgi:hypothetical protein
MLMGFVNENYSLIFFEYTLCVFIIIVAKKNDIPSHCYGFYVVFMW